MMKLIRKFFGVDPDTNTKKLLDGIKADNYHDDVAVASKFISVARDHGFNESYWADAYKIVDVHNMKVDAMLGEGY